MNFLGHSTIQCSQFYYIIFLVYSVLSENEKRNFSDGMNIYVILAIDLKIINKVVRLFDNNVLICEQSLFSSLQLNFK